jgi:hypothetical protein
MGARDIFILVVEEMKVENHETLFNQRGKVNNGSRVAIFHNYNPD